MVAAHGQRMTQSLARFHAGGITGVVPYFPVGFPNADSTVALIEAAQAAGAAAVELGVPFSDPLADGPSVQAATMTALKNGVTVPVCIAAVRAARDAGLTIPILFMGYVNPILNYGYERFAVDSAAAGLDGCIVPDLPGEEAGELQGILGAQGIALVPMVAPTSTEPRIAQSVKGGGGFVYCVSVTGVTGARNTLPTELPEFIGRVRAQTSLPVGVGFGISSRAHVEEVGKVADLAIVGSAVVDRLAGTSTADAARILQAYLEELNGQGAK